MDRQILIPLSIFLLLISLFTGCSGPKDDEVAHVFNDVPDDATWGHAVQVLGKWGYICGNGEGTFNPDATLSRAEMAVLLMKAKYGPDFMPEYTSGAWWGCWVDCAVADGLMKPVSNPNAPATRADVVTLMWLMTQEAR